MRRLLAIARRDCAAFFKSPRGYFFLALVTLVWGFYFFNILGRYNFIVARAAGMQIRSEIVAPSLQQFVIAPYFQLVLVSFALLIPLFAMRSFAEERQTGTFELLMTSPGGPWGVVLGKFIALGAIVLCLSLVAGAFPLSLLLWGSPDRGALLSGVLGLLLAGFGFTALAMACSARSERQLSAAVLGVFVLSSLLILHTSAALLPSALRTPLELLSVYLQTAQFYDGYVSLQGLVYFTLLIFLGLTLSAQGIRPRRDLLGSGPPRGAHRTVSLLLSGAFLFAGILLWSVLGRLSALVLCHLVLGLGVFIFSGLVFSARPRGESIAQRRSILDFRFGLDFLLGTVAAALLFALAVKSELFFDASDTRQFTLSDHTKDSLRSIAKNITFRYVLRDEPDVDGRAKRLLSSFVAVRPDLFSLEILDPVDYPNLSATFGITPEDAVQLTTSSFVPARALNLAQMNEENLIAALLALTEERPAKVYFLEDAGAARLSDAGPRGLSKFAARAQQEGLTPVALESAAFGIPQDTNVVALIGAQEALSPKSLEELEAYLGRGGRLFITIDPPFVSSVQNILQLAGIEARNEVVVDAEQRMFSRGKSGLQPLVHEIGEHPITNRLGGAKAVLMNVAAPVGAGSEPPLNFSVRELLWASPGSVGEAEVLPLLMGKKELSSTSAAVENSSLALGAAAQNLNDGSRLVVFGDSDWLLNAAFDYYSNASLGLNSLHWLAGNEWALAERARTEFSGVVAVTEADFAFMMVLTILAAEGFVLIGLLRLRAGAA